MAGFLPGPKAPRRRAHDAETLRPNAAVSFATPRLRCCCRGSCTSPRFALWCNCQPLRLCSKADDAVDAGHKTVVQACIDKITDAISPAELKIEGAFDDPNGSHISIYCVAEASRARAQ